jgi:hypothetical protein
MAIWKKVLLWILALVMLTMGGCYYVVTRFFDGMCATTFIEEFVSPSGKKKAVVFQIDCGATSDFNTQVGIADASVAFRESDDFPEAFFVADRDHGRAPPGKGGGPEVTVRWVSDKKIQLQHHGKARIFRSEESSRGVDVEYSAF